MVLQAYLLSTKTPVALFYLTVHHAMGQSDSHSDDVSQLAELAMV